MICIKNVNGENVNRWLTFTKNWVEHTDYTKIADGLYDITVDNEVPVILHYSDSKVIFDLGNKLFWLESCDYLEIILS